MSYIPKNIEVYNAALAGAMAGLNDGRDYTSASASSYATVSAVAVAIAQEFDTLWGAVPASGLQASAIQLNIQAYFAGRVPQSVMLNDYYTALTAIIANVSELVSVSAVSSPGGYSYPTYFANNLVTANVADLTAFTVAGNDGCTNVKGQTVLLVAQTDRTQNGPWVVGTVTAGTAPLSRPPWWASGRTINVGIGIQLSGEGVAYKNTRWSCMSDSVIVSDTDTVDFYPQMMCGQAALVSGTFTISCPIWAKSALSLTRVIANTCAATVIYAGTNGGGDGRTVGRFGTGAWIVQACVAAGTINAADVSTLSWTIMNRGNYS